MSSKRYTVEQLHKLRESPLVKKPDALPSIDQWMEGAKPVVEQNGQRKKTQTGRIDDSQENALSRLPVNLRRGTRGQDDIVLGPPKMSFTSNNRNQTRPEPEKRLSRNLSSDDAIATDRAGNFRDRFPRDRDNEPPREKPTAALVGRRTRDEDGWTSVRNRRGSQHDEGDRWQRLVVRDRDRERERDRDTDRDRDRDRNRDGDRNRHGDRDRNRDGDTADPPLRRNGVGRGRFDGPWTRDDTEADSNKSGGRFSGWRERDREKDKTRDWQRGNRYEPQPEENPEWMDDAPSASDEKQKQMQEDFQRWRESTKTGSGPAEERAAATDAVDTTDAVASKEDASASKPAAPENLGKIFGTWEEPQKDTKVETSPVKPPLPKAKSSRFVGFFAKEEIITEVDLPPRPSSSGNVNGTAEDKAGFQRIMQMLEGTSLTPKPNESVRPPPPAEYHGHYIEREQGQGRSPVDRQRDSAGFINEHLARQGAAREAKAFHQGRLVQHIPPEFEHAQMLNHDFMRPSNGRPDGGMPREELYHPADAGPSPPGPPQHSNRDSAFLLNLIQNSRQPPEQFQRPNDPDEYAQFSGPPKHMPPQQQGQMVNQRNTPSAPPGLFDHPHRRPPPEAELQPGERTQPPPHGFPFKHDGPIPEGAMPPPGLMRRNTSDANNMGGQIPRPGAQGSNMGIPSMAMNEIAWMRNGTHMGADGRMIAGPPPGLMGPQGPGPHGPQSQPPSMGPNGLQGLPGPNGPLPNGSGMRNGPPMPPPPGFPPVGPNGMPLNMRVVPPMPGAYGMVPPPPPPPPPPGAFFPGPGGPPPGVPPPGMAGPGGQPGFFGGGRGFPFEGEMRGNGRGAF